MGGLGGVKGSVPTRTGLWASFLVLLSCIREVGLSLLIPPLSHGEGGSTVRPILCRSLGWWPEQA